MSTARERLHRLSEGACARLRERLIPEPEVLSPPVSSGQLCSAREPVEFLPVAQVGLCEFVPENDHRREKIAEIGRLRQLKKGVVKELWQTDYGSEHRALTRARDAIDADEQKQQGDLNNNFVPLHSPSQLIGTQLIFQSPLFNVRGRNVRRCALIEFVLLTTQAGEVRYVGPELRQADGLAFMALLNMARDYRAGLPICFVARELCSALYGYYDGDARKRLRESLFRLQHGVLRFPHFSTQLLGRFQYPQRGLWTITLDPDIVRIFQESRFIWLTLEMRLALSEGLASWLYGYVQSQTRLIPMPVSSIHAMCGSDASPDGFLVILKRALLQLSDKGVIDAGWRIIKGRVRWRKPPARQEAFPEFPESR